MKEPPLTRHHPGRGFFIDPPVIARAGQQRTGTEYDSGLIGAQRRCAGGSEIDPVGRGMQAREPARYELSTLISVHGIVTCPKLQRHEAMVPLALSA